MFSKEMVCKISSCSDDPFCVAAVQSEKICRLFVTSSSIVDGNYRIIRD